VPNLQARAAKGQDVSEQKAAISVSKTTTRVLMGSEDPRDWDDEELAHGRRRDRNGGFQGSDPKVVPKLVQDELMRRMMRKTGERLRKMNDDALDQLELLLTGSDVDEKTRLKAIEMVLNRNVGKIPERMEVTAQTKPWEGLVVEAITWTDDPEDVIDVEGEEVIPDAS
jgi:hypothetical protein